MRLVRPKEVARAGVKDELRLRDARVERLRVGGRHNRVELAGYDERRVRSRGRLRVDIV